MREYAILKVLMMCEVKSAFLLITELRGDINRVYMKDEEGHSLRDCTDGMKGDGFKQKDSRFRLQIRKKLFTVRVVRH